MGAKTRNSVLVIHPYWNNGQLVFDDASTGLVEEPFVAGADMALALIAEAENIPGRRSGFTLLFSSEPFPGHHAVLERQEEEYGGNWYWCERVGVKGWLCPALYHYFEKAPDNIYLQIKKREKK